MASTRPDPLRRWTSKDAYEAYGVSTWGRDHFDVNDAGHLTVGVGGAAIDLKVLVDDLEKREKAHEGAMAALRPIYVAALREYAGGKLAPDANSTLRVTYGTVRGYAPKEGAEVYYPFTTATEMVAKHTGEGEFNAPANILEQVKAKNYGSYASDVVDGDLPLDFLADLDITGGNSGSATLDKNGRLVGLAFDGNYEAMASDWIFMPKITRSIQVDIRYVLWVMDAVDGADHLITEMGLTPSVN